MRGSAPTILLPGRPATRIFAIRWPRSTPSAGWERASPASACCAWPPAAGATARSTPPPAQVTVVDLSGEMLALDRAVAQERRLEIRTIEASMDDLSALAPASFDIVIQPVSTCYLPRVADVYREVARSRVAGGLYISQHKQPTSLQASAAPGPRGYDLLEPYYRTGPLPPVAGSPHRELGTLEFLHRWEELLGGMCRAGFAIEDLYEPLHGDERAALGSFAHRSRYVAPYVRIKARRVAHESTDAAMAKGVWTP